MMRVTSVVAVIASLLLISSARRSDRPCPLCGSSTNIRSVKIPKPISLVEFDKTFAGKVLYEVYFTPSGVPDFDILINAVTKFTKLNGTAYFAEIAGVTESKPTSCLSFNSSYTHDGSSKAMFTNTAFMELFFTSCPEKYVWFFRCIRWETRQRVCPIENINLGLLIQSRERTKTIPWEAVVKDLDKTGMKFGTEQLMWFNTLGEKETCSLSQ